MYSSPSTTARLLITCLDQPGIVYHVTEFLFQYGANITMLDQYTTDPIHGTFFMRLEFETVHLTLSSAQLSSCFATQVAKPFNLQWQINFASTHKKMAIFVSRHDHALMELLWRWSRKELAMDIPCIVSNHPDLAHFAKSFSVPFYHIENYPAIKTTAEQQMLALLTEQEVDGIILARYMQILSPEFIQYFEHNIINIHHSFLPAFVGADPYRQAHHKGVKLIGATAHYVTSELDMGPIIEQYVIRVSHRLGPKQLQVLGMDIERQVLARAVKWYLQDRIIVYENKTIVFDAH
jgi:formyltetrahydrofolate deformylase